MRLISAFKEVYYFASIQSLVVVALVVRTKTFALTLTALEFSRFIVEQGIYTFLCALTLFGVAQGFISSGLYKQKGLYSWLYSAFLLRIWGLIIIIIYTAIRFLLPKYPMLNIEGDSTYYVLVGAILTSLGAFETSRYQVLLASKRTLGLLRVFVALLSVIGALLSIYFLDSIIFEFYWIFLGLVTYLIPRYFRFRKSTIGLFGLDSFVKHLDQGKKLLHSSFPLFLGAITGGIIIADSNSYLLSIFDEIDLVGFSITRTLIVNYGFLIFSSLSIYFFPKLTTLENPQDKLLYVKDNLRVFVISSLGLVIIINIGAENIIGLLYKAEYVRYANFLRQGSFALLIYSIIFVYNYVLLSENKNLQYVLYNSLIPAIIFACLLRLLPLENLGYVFSISAIIHLALISVITTLQKSSISLFKILFNEI